MYTNFKFRNFVAAVFYPPVGVAQDVRIFVLPSIWDFQISSTRILSLIGREKPFWEGLNWLLSGEF